MKAALNLKKVLFSIILKLNPIKIVRMYGS